MLESIRTVFICGTFAFTVVAFSVQRKWLKEEKDHNVRTKKDKLTQDFIMEWSLLNTSSYSSKEEKLCVLFSVATSILRTLTNR